MSGSHPRDVLHRPRLRLPVTDSGYPSLSDVDEPGYSGVNIPTLRISSSPLTYSALGEPIAPC